MKKRFRPILRWMIGMTLDCVIPTQSSVIQIIHCYVGLKYFCSILPQCLFVTTDMYAYFIDISEGSVQMHLWCSEIYNDHIIANCLQSVPVKNFENWSIIGEDMDKTKVARFLAHPVVSEIIKQHNVPRIFCSSKTKCNKCAIMWTHSADIDYTWQCQIKVTVPVTDDLLSSAAHCVFCDLSNACFKPHNTLLTNIQRKVNICQNGVTKTKHTKTI